MSFIEYKDNQIITKYDPGSALSSDNHDYWRKSSDKYLKLTNQIKLGGGVSNIEKQHQKGRLTVRERLKLLLDEKVLM